MVFSCSIYMCHKIIFGIFEGMKKKGATNTTNSIRTHATGVRFSSYQFVVFFMLIYLPKVHSRLCGFFVAYEILKVRCYLDAVSYTHLRAHETKANLVCRLLLEKKKKK